MSACVQMESLAIVCRHDMRDVRAPNAESKAFTFLK